MILIFLLASNLVWAQTRIEWKETPTERIKIKYEGDREVGRWSFRKKLKPTSQKLKPTSQKLKPTSQKLKPASQKYSTGPSEELMAEATAFLKEKGCKSQVDMLIALNVQGRRYWKSGDIPRAEVYLTSAAAIAPRIYHANTTTTGRYMLAGAQAFEVMDHNINASMAYGMTIKIFRNYKNEVRAAENLYEALLGQARLFMKFKLPKQALPLHNEATELNRKWKFDEQRRCTECERILLPHRKRKVCSTCPTTRWHELTGKSLWRLWDRGRPAEQVQ